VSDEEELSLCEDRVSQLFLSFSEACRDLLESRQSTRTPPSAERVTCPVDHAVIDRMKRALTACDFSKPYLFVGYQRRDMEALVYKDCIMLGKMGINYWVDNANMYGCDQNSQGWKTVINNALSSCSLYIPYVSEGFFDSVPCCEEVKNFFTFNPNAGILVLLQEGFTTDMVIQKILTYDNILQGEDAKNMIRLFQAKASLTNRESSYTIDQIYRICNASGFAHYVIDPLFYNSFRRYGLVDEVRFPDYQSWYTCGMQILKEEFLI
jgi:hypothetical protein